ncbi:MAG TPA: hypothetical protein VLL97_11560, partial [Acidobacteriota bacterium]|nr:hypothetical protein [Acidobacteriota bacterium]
QKILTAMVRSCLGEGKRLCIDTSKGERPMNNKREVYTKCEWCDQEIFFGNASMTINRNIEKVDRDGKSGEAEISVIQSHCLLELCAGCGNKLDDQFLQKILMALKPEAVSLIM